eukprot:15476918-Alexandrium_andersonii.AAC.1
MRHLQSTNIGSTASTRARRTAIHRHPHNGDGRRGSKKPSLEHTRQRAPHLFFVHATAPNHDPSASRRP